ncbi:MAG: hypothetical protein EXR92_03460 [Gemmatimonadetes bacterium]|nr:hypothetical protein [Gemmatimonadota bacterium]
MHDFNAFLSPEYPVLHSVGRSGAHGSELPDRQMAISLGLLVKGIPSFLATVHVDEHELVGIRESLDGGSVRVAVVGMSVNGSDLPDEGPSESEPWQHSLPGAKSLPAAFLSLVCADGRRIGIARIVAREESGSPEDVARFVLRQITQGVQIPDLASTR